ncbi:hypothetical protein [uncultured Parabacteroides sp.]|uniref:hypothetical protein n=1 Tax=uncultured Parabacteroides sp. TaxID=512312 RepID=UPI0025950722|nr:hypothetical protein [uncultured Parabacteroides sp.]
MKINRLFNKSITGMLVLTGILSGCVEEEYETSQTVPLSISSTCPVLSVNNGTRAAGNAEVKIALNTTGGDYASVAETYQVTSTAPITFKSANPLMILNNKTSTPLTIYGWLDEKTPVSYSNNNVTVSGGKISGIELSPAYACVGVRILMDGKTEAANKYTINSNVLKGIGTASNNNAWNTAGATPLLNSYGAFTCMNTDKEKVLGIKASDLNTDFFKGTIPTTISAGASDLFTITCGDKQLSVPSPNEIKIESGHYYLFTVNIAREASVSIINIASIETNQLSYIIVQPPGTERKVGIYSKQDWDNFLVAYRGGQSLQPWVDGSVLNLYTDIDLENKPWVPFGISGADFSFDGHGHTISNLNVSTYEPSTGGAGFYGQLKEYYSVNNLTIKGVTISPENYEEVSHARYAGAIVGMMKNFSNMSQCHVEGVVTIRTNTVGGIVGSADGSVYIYASTYEPEPSSVLSGATMGGIIGKFDANYAGLYACIAHDFALTATDETIYIGGIYGYAGGRNFSIASCIAYNITSDKTGAQSIGNGGNPQACFYLNAFETSSSGISNLADFSSQSVISALNSQLGGAVPYCYVASSTPDKTPPVVQRTR